MGKAYRVFLRRGRETVAGFKFWGRDNAVSALRELESTAKKCGWKLWLKKVK